MTSFAQSNRVKIGIRPTIDGRRMGVRESLEEQTMQMAKSVAELLQTFVTPMVPSWNVSFLTPVSVALPKRLLVPTNLNSIMLV